MDAASVICVVETEAHFSRSAAAAARTAAAADPLAGAGALLAMASSSLSNLDTGPAFTAASGVVDLPFAAGDELLELLVDSHIEARIRVLGKDLLPAFRGDDVSGA